MPFLNRTAVRTPFISRSTVIDSLHGTSAREWKIRRVKIVEYRLEKRIEERLVKAHRHLGFLLPKGRDREQQGCRDKNNTLPVLHKPLLTIS